MLSEASFQLKNATVVLDMVQEGLLTLAFDARRQVKQLRNLAVRYADRKPDFADLSCE